jgi:hypothetical protein
MGSISEEEVGMSSCAMGPGPGDTAADPHPRVGDA